MRIKKSVKTREGREIVRPFFSYPSSTQSEINKFIREFRETSLVTKRRTEFFHPENFYRQLHFLRFKAQEFCGRILHDEESETISWTRSSFSPRGKIHRSFLQKSTCALVPSFMQPSNVFIKYTGLLQ